MRLVNSPVLCCILVPRILFTSSSSFFFFNDPPTTEIYTLSLHDALPIFQRTGRAEHHRQCPLHAGQRGDQPLLRLGRRQRSEEHTSELQSHSDLVCRLLLEKKKKRRDSTQKGGTCSTR